jgi:hypothetical protein
MLELQQQELGMEAMEGHHTQNGTMMSYRKAAAMKGTSSPQ